MKLNRWLERCDQVLKAASSLLGPVNLTVSPKTVIVRVETAHANFDTW